MYKIGIIVSMSDAEISILISSLAILAVVPYFWHYFIPKRQVEAARKTPIVSEGDNPSGRYEFFSLVRGIAMIGIILIHVSYFYVYRDSFAFEFNALLNNFFRFALPIFFITSGILLADPELRVRWLVKFYTDRFLYVVVPYLLVTLFLVLASGSGVKEFVYMALTGTASLPFYFVLVLLQLYILYPIIYSLAQKRWFIFFSLMLSISVYLSGIGRVVGEVYTFLPFLFFFVWGIYMREYFLTSKKRFVWWPWILVVLLFTALHFIFGIDFFFNGQYFYGIAVLMLLFNLYYTEKIPGFLASIFSWIGDRSLWIFLLHFPVMEALFWYFKAHPVLAVAWADYVLFMYLSVVVSIGVAGMCAFVHEKIKKWIVG